MGKAKTVSVDKGEAWTGSKGSSFFLCHTSSETMEKLTVFTCQVPAKINVRDDVTHKKSPVYGGYRHSFQSAGIVIRQGIID